MKGLAYIFFTTLLSCSLFMGEEKSEVESVLKEPKKTPNFCAVPKRSFQFLASNKNLIDSYQRFLKALGQKKINLTFIDKYVLYSLMQMNVRPDQASPTSRLQVFITHKGKDFYFDFFTKKSNAYPFLYGLNYILKYFSSNYSLKQLGSFLDIYQKMPILVSEQFYHFLKQNKDKLKKSSNLSKYYLRAGKILRPGESIPKPKYKYLISRYKKKNKNVLFFNTLIKYIPGDKSEVNTQGVEIRCNMDLNLYNYSLYLSKEPLGDSANFAFYHQNSLALGVATQGTDTLKGLWNTNLIQGTGIKFQAKFCKIKSNDSKIVLVSSKGKDPGQHLFHFLKNKVQYSSSLENIDDFIISPRHLYLVNPFRVVYESGRGSKQKLGTFLNSGIPIYHSSSLGRVWAWGKFKGQRSLIKDPRDSPYINCPKQQ